MKSIGIIFLAILLLSYSCLNSSRSKKDKAETEAVNKLLSDDSLLTLVQYRTFQYFWEGAEPNSGMARERIYVDGKYPQNDMNVVTSGGTGFGVMAILSGIERKFITREEGFKRLRKIVDFLVHADRYHGAWAHWIYGETGKTKPFSPKDNGADIVETAYLIQGLLTVRQYFINGNEAEKSLAADIDKLWREVEWSWFTKGGEDIIYWHWSPDYKWDMNFGIRGYNECLIVYVLAASSPTFPVTPVAYHKGWARSGTINTKIEKFGYALTLNHNGSEEYGGPLFWAHYSFLGLDPRNLKDRYADYWNENSNQTLINWRWCVQNSKNYKGYSKDCWGLTASYSVNGYAAHAPGEKTDLGVISPTASISSIPYTPVESMDAIRHFYNVLGDKLWGKYGFYDAFSEQAGWFPQRYLAIDQGPAVVMIENFRTGLLWDIFMSCPEIKTGLTYLDFTFKKE